MGFPIKQDRKSLHNLFHSCIFTAPQNQGSKQENRITTALVLFTMCSLEEKRLKFVTANVHQDCREVVFSNGWKAFFRQKGIIHMIHFPCSVSPGCQDYPVGQKGRSRGQGQGCTHRRRPGARRALPSWAASCPRGRPRSPARCGSAAAAGTPRGRRRLRHAGASWGSNTHTALLKRGTVPTSPKISKCKRF